MKFHEYARIYKGNLFRKHDFMTKYSQLNELGRRESTLYDDGRRGILIILFVPLVGH